MKQRARKSSSIEHEAVYHAASCCQAVSLSLTPRRLHAQKKTCSVEGKKTGRFASQRTALLSYRMTGMHLPSRLQRRTIIGLMRSEHSEDDSHPNVRQSTNRNAMAFAFRTLALIVSGGPGFLPSALPGKLMQRIPQRFDTAQTAVGFGVVPALKQDRRTASQGLQTGSTLIARGIITDFGEQTRSETFACSGQAQKDSIVFMAQKKAFNLLVVGGNLFEQRQQLCHQGQRQACIGARGHRSSLQVPDPGALASTATRLRQKAASLGLRGACPGLFRARTDNASGDHRRHAQNPTTLGHQLETRQEVHHQPRYSVRGKKTLGTD